MKKKIPSKVVVSGNPGKIIRNINVKDEEFWEMGKKIYMDLAKKYLKEGLQPIVSYL